MIGNDVSNQLSRYFNRGTQNEGGRAATAIQRLKDKHDVILGRVDPEEEETEDAATSSGAQTATDTLSPEEKRRQDLAAILEKINAEEAEKWPNRASSTTQATTTQVVTSDDPAVLQNMDGFTDFLNDLPLFNEFKTGLMEAFQRMDSASAGFISAQYELNYTCINYVANEAGIYEYQETTVNLKLDIAYVKAASGGQSGASIAELIGSSTDLDSLVNNLRGIGGGQAKAATPNDIMSGLKDYFSPERTADRILDFATAFFPLSDAYKKYGDTEEAREEFAELMRNAIQKGFDQALGQLGAVPKSVMDGIDKTHELVFQGIEDFVKNGLNGQKQEDGIYAALEQFALSFEVNYSHKSVTVSSGTYGANGETQAAQTASALDTQA
ncbi:MAG: DUF5610 domain-containing protein [Planctomycetes bacterium]|nr:DUF5610 domain-containing protein [Planctomycetota bacterium]